MTDFTDKIQRMKVTKGTDTALMISPQMVKMPLPMKRHDDPFLPFSKEIIRATQDLMVAYVFDMAAYLRLGAAGAIALERTISYAIDDSVLILHGPFAGAAFAEISDENAFAADAVTIASYDDAATYLQRSDRGAFVLSTADKLPKAQPGLGIFNLQSRKLTLQLGDNTITLRLFGDEIVYASSSEAYGPDARTALEKYLGS